MLKKNAKYQRTVLSIFYLSSHSIPLLWLWTMYRSGLGKHYRPYTLVPMVKTGPTIRVGVKWTLLSIHQAHQQTVICQPYTELV